MESEDTLALVTLDFLVDCGIPANDPRGQFVFDGHDYVITGSVSDMFTVQAVEN